MFAFETQGKLKPVAARTLKVQNNYGDTQELKNGDKILTITMNREPVSWNAEMGIKLVPAISPSIIKPPSPYKIVTLEKVLEIIRQTCFDIISKFKNNP